MFNKRYTPKKENMTKNLCTLDAFVTSSQARNSTVFVFYILFFFSNLFAQIYRLQTLEKGNTSIITVKLEKKCQDKL